MDDSLALGLGSLHPGYAAEDDYPLMGKILGPRVRVKVMHTPWERTPTTKAR
ncbi:MAG: hypothetical protein H0W36_10095 [Gemmatimonadetes bacterium]|jgi:hypothetical protein|nr:hypothetical protein [Gemmatimonadota bacterium]